MDTQVQDFKFEYDAKRPTTIKCVYNLNGIEKRFWISTTKAQREYVVQTKTVPPEWFQPLFDQQNKLFCEAYDKKNKRAKDEV